MAEPAWVGGASWIPQTDTITIANTWATADDVVITINGNNLTVVVGTDTSTANVATLIKEAINGDTQTGTGDHTVTPTIANGGGQAIKEFTEVIATVVSSVVTVTTTATVNANKPGKPFTMSVVETTAGDGTSVEATATASTGPHDGKNADNWTTGSIPTTSDNVVWDGRALYDMLYGLDFSSVVVTSLKITNGFRKVIGLPEINFDSQSNQYEEYRGTYLQFRSTALDITGAGGGSQRLKLDLGSATACTCNVASNGRKSGGQSQEAAIPAVLLKGTNASNVLRVTKGDVGVAFFDGEAAHLGTLHVGPGQDATVQCGDGVDIANATVTQSGGILTIDSATGAGTIVQTGGIINILDGAHAAITAQDSFVFYESAGTLTTLTNRAGGNVEFSTDASRTVTNTTLYADSTLSDTGKTVTPTNGWDLNGCGLEDVTLIVGKHLTLTPSSI
jgi:hypothetical protein